MKFQTKYQYCFHNCVHVLFSTCGVVSLLISVFFRYTQSINFSIVLKIYVFRLQYVSQIKIYQYIIINFLEKKILILG